MNDEERLVARLRDAVGSDDFEDVAHEVVEVFETFDDPSVFVGPVIRLIEDSPDADLGSPGPLVHFVERFYMNGYEALLTGSLERRPTPYTAWMLHRIINDPTCPFRHEYIDLLRRTAARNDVDDEVKQAIQTFLG